MRWPPGVCSVALRNTELRPGWSACASLLLNDFGEVRPKILTAVKRSMLFFCAVNAVLEEHAVSLFRAELSQNLCD
jgi:hypothetical protein